MICSVVRQFFGARKSTKHGREKRSRIAGAFCSSLAISCPIGRTIGLPQRRQLGQARRGRQPQARARPVVQREASAVRDGWLVTGTTSTSASPGSCTTRTGRFFTPLPSENGTRASSTSPNSKPRGSLLVVDRVFGGVMLREVRGRHRRPVAVFRFRLTPLPQIAQIMQGLLPQLFRQRLGAICRSVRLCSWHYHTRRLIASHLQIIGRLLERDALRVQPRAAQAARGGINNLRAGVRRQLRQHRPRQYVATARHCLSPRMPLNNR